MNPEDLIPEDLDQTEVEQEEEIVDEEDAPEEEEEDALSAPPAQVPNENDNLAALLAKALQPKASVEPEEDEDAYLSPKEIMRRVEAQMEKKYGAKLAALEDRVEKPSAINRLSARAEIDANVAQTMFGDMSAQDLEYLMQKPGFIEGLKVLKGNPKKAKSSQKPPQTGAKPTTAKPKGVTIPPDLVPILEGYAKTYGKNSPQYKARYDHLMSQEIN